MGSESGSQSGFDKMQVLSSGVWNCVTVRGRIVLLEMIEVDKYSC